MSTASVIGDAMRLFQAGRQDEAVQRLAGAAQSQPDDPDLCHTLGALLAQIQRLAEGLPWLERAVLLRPAWPDARVNLGNALFAVGRQDEAIEQWRQAAHVAPDDPRAFPKLIAALINLARFDEAAAAMQEAAARQANFTPSLSVALPGLLVSGRAGEAVGLLREAQRRYGPAWQIQQGLMMPIMYWDGISADEASREIAEFGRLMARATPEDRTPFANSRDPERPLRIGYLSQDFRNQAAGHFIEPILAGHDRSRYAAVCYAQTVFGEDELTARLRGFASAWIDVTKMDDATLARRVRADGIDLFVDLIGHGPHNRIPALARRLAPVQITYIGYPATTGLPTMDYRIVDALTDPPGHERLSTERLIRLPGSFLCYAPPPHAPPISPRPAAQPITFGSFNTMLKVSPWTVAVWARILRELPASRLLLKNQSLAHAQVAERVRAMFAQHGIEPSRLDLIGHTAGKAEHMRLYERVDVALDPFPYNGTTTTVEALWMGVPVVALAGDRHVARVGVSLLTNAGLGDCIAADDDQYVRIALGLAADEPRRRELRAGLRQTVRRALCDGRAFTRRLEEVYRAVWRAWCNRKPPVDGPTA